VAVVVLPEPVALWVLQLRILFPLLGLLALKSLNRLFIKVFLRCGIDSIRDAQSAGSIRTGLQM